MSNNKKLEEVATMEDIEYKEISNIKNKMREMYALWDKIGINIVQKTERVNLVWNHVKYMLTDMVEEENNFYKEINERINNYTKNIKELSNVLSVPVNEPQGSLIKIEEILRQKLDTLIELKNSRIKTYQDLKSEELEYCQILNVQEYPTPPSSGGVQSETDISELKHFVEMLKEEKDRRLKKLYIVKKEFTTIFETTELVPDSALEEEILSGRDTLSLTDDTFKTLEEAINNAKLRKEELENKHKSLVDRLNVFWQLLKIDKSKRIEFLSRHLDCRLSTIYSLQQELERCNNIKKENIGEFISDLRIELIQLWDKCFVSQAERELFHYFSATDMSDEVLEEHEVEVDKWKKYHSKIKHILKKIDERHHLWKLMIVFENKATDPSRFKNRKGNLLQEEKERKKLQKDIRALENHIFTDIESFNEQEGLTFLYNGEDFKTFVTNQQAERNNQKENEKLERQNKNLLQFGNAVILRTPSKKPLVNTQRTEPIKLLKYSRGASAFQTSAIGNARVVPSTAEKRAIKSTNLFPGRPKVIRKKDQNTLQEINKQTASSAQTSFSDGTTYTDFASEMNSPAKYHFRSSVLATKKRGGTRISQTESRSKRKSAAKSLRKSPKSTSKTDTNLTPAKRKLNLPF